MGISPTTASAGDNVTITLSISDPTGVGKASVYLSSSDGGVTGASLVHLPQWVLVSGDATNGTYEATLTVDNVPGGVYRARVSADDELFNNTGQYFDDVITIEGPS